jgi:TRAP-type C4-dicarboxylate transport system permease small subunit
MRLGVAMQHIMRVIESFITFLSGPVQGWILFLMMILVLVDVATRYVLQNPLSMAEEYGAYMLVAITCMGLAFTWREGSHVRVELLVSRLSPAVQRGLRMITILIAFGFTLFMVIASYQLVSFSFMFGTRSGTWIRTPVAWPQITLIIGTVLLFFQLVIEIIKAVRAVHPGKGGKS